MQPCWQTKAIQSLALTISGRLRLNTRGRFDNLDLIFGYSARAHIAAQAALLASNPEYEQAIQVKSSIKPEQLKGAVLYCGPYDVSKMLDTGNKQIDYFASRIGWALLGDKASYPFSLKVSLVYALFLLNRETG